MRRFAFLAILCALGGKDSACAETVAIRAAKIYPAPDALPITDGVILVRDGKITAVGESKRVAVPHGARVSECGGIVTAGFQNSHVHFLESRWDDAAHKPAAELERSLQDMLTRYGFTTVFDTASDEENTIALRSRIDRGELRGPRILTVGWGIFPVNGLPYYLDEFPERVRARLHQPKNAFEARAAVRANLTGGADATKIFLVTAPAPGAMAVLSPDVARAAAEVTHASHKLLLAHPTSIAGLRAGLDAGVDVFVHTTLGEQSPWDAALVQRMVSQQVSVIPTFKLWYYELAKQSVPADVAHKLVDATLDELRAFEAAGGQVLFGTDVGYMHEYDPTEEYVLMAKAGMSPAQILESLTTAPAARWKEEKRHGQVAKGFAADLVVLAADPVEDVKNFANVNCVLRAGTPIYTRAGT